MMTMYQDKKARLLRQVKQCENHKISLYKESSNLFRPRVRGINDKLIDVRSFNQVLSVDPDKLIADVEGMTTYEDLVKETLKYSCLPTVVPELKSITIGGALSGCGIESSSFRFGLVHETISEAEVLLSDGQIVVCAPDNAYRDLFFALPNTFGTLGYALKVKVQLIPVKKYIKLTHIHFSDPQAFFESLKLLCAEKSSYIDGVIFDGHEMYITKAELVDEAPFTSRYDYMKIYYQSIREKKEDYLTTSDYIWRWDTDWFWCSKVFFMQNPVMRLLFGKMMLKSSTYTKIMHYVNRSPRLKSFLNLFTGNTESVIQDVLIPIDKAAAFLEFFQREIGIKPVWICPAHPYSQVARYDFCPLEPNQLYVDFGFWDSVKTDKEEGYYNRKIEEKVSELKGFKSLYSSSYYSEKEFWTIYDRSRYMAMKQKYDPRQSLSDLYIKSTRRKA